MTKRRTHAQPKKARSWRWILLGCVQVDLSQKGFGEGAWLWNHSCSMLFTMLCNTNNFSIMRSFTYCCRNVMRAISTCFSGIQWIPMPLAATIYLVRIMLTWHIKVKDPCLPLQTHHLQQDEKDKHPNDIQRYQIYHGHNSGRCIEIHVPSKY